MTARAYPGEPAVEPGGTLTLHVWTDARQFRIRIYRAGARFAPAAAPTPWLPGRDVAPGAHDRPWHWPAYALRLAPELTPGAYVAWCETPDAAAPSGPDMRSAAALFVVRGAPAAPLLVNLPLFTYQAYNVAHIDGTLGAGEGDCLYRGPRTVTLARPGGGTGGHPWDEVHADVYDRDSPRQTFAHWDARALRWLERNGYAYDVCTDLDLHRGAVDLERYGTLLLFGHNEYWTRAMRTGIEGFVAGGGMLAIFGGNTCWFRVRYDDATQTIVRDGKWDDDPEERLTGASYRFGGGQWRGGRTALGYTVADARDPLFAGTKVRNGDVFGATARLIGYECDGAAPADAGVTLLAAADLAAWNVPPETGEIAAGGRATFVRRAFGRGTVVNAASVDWARVLDDGDPVVEQITRNVLARTLATARR